MNFEERDRLTGKHDRAGDIRLAVPQVKNPAADLGERPRLCPCARPRIMDGLRNAILKFIKRLRSYAGHLILSVLAVGAEVVAHVGARRAHAKVRELARKPRTAAYFRTARRPRSLHEIKIL